MTDEENTSLAQDVKAENDVSVDNNVEDNANDGESQVEPVVQNVAEVAAKPSGDAQLQEDISNFLPDEAAGQALSQMGDISLKFEAILGRVEISMDQFLKLGRGAIIELNQPKEGFIDLEVNGHCVGKGDITAVDEAVAVIVSKLGADRITSADDEVDMAAAMGGGTDDEMDMAAAMESMD